MPGYPTATVWNCGVKDFHFDYSLQNFWVSFCGLVGSSVKFYQNGLLLINASNASPGTVFGVGANVLSPGKYTATAECPNTIGISYWDICLEWETPPSGTVLPGGQGYSIPGVLKEVLCANGRTPCCPSPPCIAEENDAQDLA